MKAVILAGGLGTRLSEETELRPKPMVEIDGKPVLWHVMKIYSHYGINDFIICLGYRGETIKAYFANYFLNTSDVTVDLKENTFTYHKKRAEDWKITLIDTGESSMTGGRLARVKPFITDDVFCFTYGDGVADIDIGASIDFHHSHGKDATITAALPPARFGALHISDDKVTAFQEKPEDEVGLVNAGFFVLNRNVIDRIDGDQCVWEQGPLKGLAEDGQLRVFKHNGFWHPMDTLKDKNDLNEMAESGLAPWKVW